ncbi:hypothetical protein L873DRAFT_1807348 [Choiromyces venosus 120613-1]|uniref:Copper transport protein n=1 Tax=Choiromyces venosus 120613-1 TaxID=1336337 RepID=A0A3N4JLI4_9PEZI|nr:hypothetical protein L873DRAFT_1807348 [Choiromyces venosus 120613-1]
MSMMDMSMTFHTSITDPLYSSAWKPSSAGAYAGAITFLILLAFTYRFLIAWKIILEHRWATRDGARSVLIVAAGKADSLSDSEDGNSRRMRMKDRSGKPWRWSVDLPRGGMQAVISGVGYLLMLAVMSFNVGYFFAVLAGIFLGEVVFGRWIRGIEH